MASNLSLLIVSCEKFSDLWEANLLLLNDNWANRNIETILVSDSENHFEYDNVRTLFAGADTSYSGRIRFALEHIKSKYVLLTLDDYFLIKTVSNDKFDHLLQVMEREKVSYLRLFRYLESNEKVGGEKNLRYVPTNRTYMVNLYPSLWKVDDLKKIVGDNLSAWDLEVKMTLLASQYKLKCMLSYGGEFPIMDVVRKGKMLRRPARYLKRRGLYHGQRPLIPVKEAIRLKTIFLLKRIIPHCVVVWVKGIMKKHGHKYYSD